jgi:RNA polymerase sigma-70 factor (ECF subfamily)
MIRQAAAGEESARSLFASRYLPCVRAYLAARWRGSPLAEEVEDAVQEVFLDCFRQGGALERLDRERASSFRAFLYGLARNAALHVETRRARDFAKRGTDSFHPDVHPDREESLSRLFDRAWAQRLLGEAERLQAARAEKVGPPAVRRVELLRLRFRDGLPIRDIATRWGEDATRMHTEYAQARKEFLRALRDVLGLGDTCPPERVKAECERLLELLGRN